jgi:hypothetical protein
LCPTPLQWMQMVATSCLSRRLDIPMGNDVKPSCFPMLDRNDYNGWIAPDKIHKYNLPVS